MKLNLNREQIYESIIHYYNNNYKHKEFIPGISKVNYAGRVFNQEELLYAVDAVLDYWLTEGRFSEDFSYKLSKYLNIDNIILTNSGSSANLLALSALTSNKLLDKRLVPGDEVITVAAAFPSTVVPIIQNNLIPVFVDIELGTYNINVNKIEQGLSNKTKCIILSHTLGNPFNIEAVTNLSRKYGLWLIEDNCDALGSIYQERKTGTFGDISTMSFYPAHHITTGEGGAIACNDDNLAMIIKSFRDWGRDCYCSGGESNTCGKRFTQQFGKLPYGYDHKYVYSELGYNLKMTDIQAAIGSAQMDKLPSFVEKRKLNYCKWNNVFKEYDNYFILPNATDYSEPAWFAYPLTVKRDAPFSRDNITTYLNSNLIETRNMFAGNIIRQPSFMNTKYRVSGTLKNTDVVMNSTFFLGTYPGLTQEMIDYTIEKIEFYLDKFNNV